MYYVFPILIVVLTVVYFVYSRRKLAGYLEQNADKNVSAIGQRLGLAVVRGDPATNLYVFQQPAGDFTREIVLEGRPYGRPVRFTIVDGQATSDWLVVRHITHTFGCHLQAQVATNLPAFEAVQRNPNQYLVPQLEFAERPELREVSTGNPQIDALFSVRAADPRVGPMLVAALSVLATQQFAHLAGEGATVFSSFTRMALPYFAYAPDEFLFALEAAACAVEGRPVPAKLTAMPLAGPPGGYPGLPAGPA